MQPKDIVWTVTNTMLSNFIRNHGVIFRVHEQKNAYRTKDAPHLRCERLVNRMANMH